MKNEKLLNAIGKINDDFIGKTAPNSKKENLPKKALWRVAAACLTICAFGAIYLINSYQLINNPNNLVEISQNGYNTQFLFSDLIDIPTSIKVENQVLNEILASELTIYSPSGTSAFKTEDLLYFADETKNGIVKYGEDSKSSSDQILNNTGINDLLLTQGFTLKYDKNLSNAYSGSYYNLSNDIYTFYDGVFISQVNSTNFIDVQLAVQSYEAKAQTVEALSLKDALKDCFFIGAENSLQSQNVSISNIRLIYVDGLPFYMFKGELSEGEGHSYNGFALAFDGSTIEDGADLIASSMQSLISKSAYIDKTKLKADEKPGTAITEFFDAFEKSDFEAMKRYCTTDFINAVFHSDNVWGMKWAKVVDTSALIEDANAHNAAVFVSVQMIASPDSALYQGNNDVITTSFFITLIQDENGTWLLNGMQTGLPSNYDINSETEQLKTDDSSLYRSAITDSKYEQAKKVAEDYYSKVVQSVESLELAPDTDSAYENKNTGSIIVFVGTDTTSKAMRHIVLEKDQNSSWVVTGEGY